MVSEKERRPLLCGRPCSHVPVLYGIVGFRRSGVIAVYYEAALYVTWWVFPSASVKTASIIMVSPSYVMVMVPSAILQFRMVLPDSSSIFTEVYPELAVISAPPFAVIVYVPAGGVELLLSA